MSGSSGEYLEASGAKRLFSMTQRRTAIARSRAPEDEYEAILKSAGVAYEKIEGHRGCRKPDCPHALEVKYPMGGQSRYHYDFYVSSVPKKRVEVKRSVGYSIYTLEKVLAAARHWPNYVVACDQRFVKLMNDYQRRVGDTTKVTFEVVL